MAAGVDPIGQMDEQLVAKAQWIAITNPKLRPVAQAVASGIALASITRRR